MRRATFALALLSTLAACTSTPPATNTGGPLPPSTDSCNAGAAQSFVGKQADAQTVEQARIAAGAEVARVLKPGQVVTMEYRFGRLNIDVDANTKITGVRCG